MRTLVDIPEQQISDLAQICEANRISRAEAIRQAIASYIEQNRPGAPEAFGILRKQGLDSLSYPEKEPAEW